MNCCLDILFNRADDPAAKAIRRDAHGIHPPPHVDRPAREGVDNDVTSGMTLDHRLGNHFPRRQR